MRKVYLLLLSTICIFSSTIVNSQLIISEFRVRGPNGANDEYIEIYNNSGADHTVASISGTGYGVAASNGVTRFTIPNGTVIPAGGHYLGVNSVGYSLASYPAGNGTTATGDATYASDIPDNAGIALFNNNTGGGSYVLANRMDAVGSTSEANTLYKEGTGYPALVPFSIDYCFHRKVESGVPQDSNNNAADFKFEDTNGTSAGAGQRLGAPGPENLSSPLNSGSGLVVAMLDPAAADGVPPNYVRDFTSDPANNSTFGTIDVRFRITNNTGGNITRLRLRITDITTFPSPSGTSDLRPRTSTAVVVTTSMGNVTVQGTTLEQPPSQPNGGGHNSSMSIGTITLGTPLANGATQYLRVLFGIQQTGFVNAGFLLEALPGGGGGDAGSGSGSSTPFRITGVTDGTILLNPEIPDAAGDVIISEFRLRGPNGANDEFVELYNTSNNDITIVSSDGSVGWSVAASDGLVRFIIPNGTVIPGRGYYLGVNTGGYSLTNYGGASAAIGNASYATNIPDNAGIALFNTSNPANLNLANRVDAVGSVAEANVLYKEGAGYPTLTPFSIDYTFYRKTDGGAPLDSDNNATDFKFEDTNGTSAGAGQSLGAPGPQQANSPIRAGANVLIEPAEPTAAAEAFPNVVYDPTSNPGANSTFGNLSLRYKITNTGSVNITRMRLRIDSINTFPSASGIADLRPITSANTTVNFPSWGSTPVLGTTLEQPPSQPNGGGFNSSFSVPTITLGTPLAPGASIYVQVVLGLQQSGNYNFHLTPEVSPGDNSAPDMPIITRGATCPAITVNNPATTTGTTGTAFSQTFTQSGGAAPASFATASPLPAGLTLATNGTLSGTPTVAGTYPITVTVTDANGCGASGPVYNLVISDPPCGAGPTQTFTNSTPVSISPTGTSVVSSTLLVSGAPPHIYDLDVITTLAHTFASDLDITITSPAGTVVTLTSDNGGGNDNVFNGTTWNDDANPLGQVPYTSNSGLVTDHTYTNLVVVPNLVPEEPLGAFIGENPNGLWTIRISDDAGGDGGTLSNWSLVIGGNYVPPTVTSGSYSNNTPVVISSSGTPTVTSTINVAGAGTSISDVNLVTNILHTSSADIDMTLTSPAGTIVTITTDNGGTNDNVFNGTTWNDDANPLGQVPYTSNPGMVTDHTYTNLTVVPNLTPEEALAAFIGENPNGVWTLTISDDLTANGGTLSSWSLNIETSVCAPPTCVLTCPANITVSNTAGQCGAIVNYPAITGSGTCGAITSSPASGSFFPVGTTVVTATSASGFGFCTFTVTVNDTESPTITCPGNVSANSAANQCGAIVNYPAPTVSDNCPGVTVTSSPASGSFFPVGVTIVTVTATDASGNSSNCSFSVTVNDVTPPTITCPANVVSPNDPNQCGAIVTFANPSMTDNCLSLQAPTTILAHGAGAITVAGNNLPGGFFFDLQNTSANPVNVTALSVRFGSNSIEPVSSPKPVNVYVTTSATSYVGNTTNAAAWTTIGTNISVNIAGPNSEFSIFNLPGGGFTLAPGASRGVFVFGTQASLVYNSAGFSNTTPISNGTLSLTPGMATGTLFTNGFSPRTPNVIIHYAGTMTQTAGLASGSFFPVGVTTNTFQATDPSGNTATCSFTVTVNDTQAPVITCPANITVTTPVGSCTANVNYTVTATDNCPGVTTALLSGLASGAAFPIGVNTVTWRATDASGNTSQCSFTVTVIDGQLPVISQQPANINSCVGSNATFSVIASNVVTYQWQSFSGGVWSNIAGATSSTYTVNNVTTAMNTNTFRVILNGLCTSVTSNMATLFVNTLPILSLSTSLPPFLLPGQLLDITATGIPPGGSFVFQYLNNGVWTTVPSSGNVLTGIGVGQLGDYRVVYTDPNGCTSTSAVLTITGMQSDNMWVYPNPNFGQFTVRFYNSNPENATVNVYNAIGQKVYSRSLTTTLPYTNIDIDLGPTAKNGVYVVELVNGSGNRVGAAKVVVRPN